MSAPLPASEESGTAGDVARRQPLATPDTAIGMMTNVQQAHLLLSQMADQKASILMGTNFVIFTLAVGQSNYGSMAFAPLVVLGGFSFAAAVLAALSILPAIGSRKPRPVNLLFFGSYCRFPEDEYVRRIMEVLEDDEAVYRTMARDIYQNGLVLAHKKYRWLGYAYRVFLIGLTASLITFIGQFIYHFGH